MAQPNDPLAEFRRLVNRRAQHSAAQWDASRRLIDAQSFPATLRRLCGLVQEKPLLPSIKELLHLVCSSKAERAQDLNRESLKMLTGLPPSKAFRALCLYFDLIEHPGSRWPVPSLSVEQIEQHVRHMASPFDLLLHTDAPSVLDLGAGDLSFAKELAALYAPPLQQQHRRFILHCLDRLQPHSKLGGPLHAEAATVRALQHQLGEGFAFWPDQDMFDLRQLDDQGKLAPQYTIVTCWAPATPTFAYEPSRLSPAVITEDLSKTKGSFRQARFEGEPALVVGLGVLLDQPRPGVRGGPLDPEVRPVQVDVPPSQRAQLAAAQTGDHRQPEQEPPLGVGPGVIEQVGRLACRRRVGPGLARRRRLRQLRGVHAHVAPPGRPAECTPQHIVDLPGSARAQRCADVTAWRPAAAHRLTPVQPPGW